MVSALPHTRSSLSEKCGCTFFPILADLTAYAVVSRVTKSTQAGRVAGFLAGAGVWTFFSRYTSTLVGLAGAALYLAYKVGHFYFTRVVSSRPHTIEDLKIKIDELENILTITDESEIDFKDQLFKEKLAALPIHSTGHLLWRKPEVLNKAEEIMEIAQGIILKYFNKLGIQTRGLEQDDNARFTKMAELYMNGGLQPQGEFEKALDIFLTTYRWARGQQYWIFLPNLKNGEKNDLYQIIGTGTDQMGQLFMKGNNTVHNRLYHLYNSTLDQLTPLLKKTPKANSPWIEKDTQAIPGDPEFSNPTNPFKLWPQELEKS